MQYHLLPAVWLPIDIDNVVQCLVILICFTKQASVSLILKRRMIIKLMNTSVFIHNRLINSEHTNAIVSKGYKLRVEQ